MPGLILTASESGNESLKVFAPYFIDFWNATSHFIYRPKFKIETYEIEDEIVHDFQEVEVTGVSLQDEHGQSIGYICKTPMLPGKLDVAKAMQLGVPKGPLLGKLKQGCPVTLPDGSRTIEPSEVVDKPFPSLFSIIVPRCETETLIEQLHCRIPWTRFQRMGVTHDHIKCMFHFSDEVTVRHPQYTSWVMSFGTTCKHYLMGRPAAMVHALRQGEPTTVPWNPCIPNGPFFAHTLSGVTTIAGEHGVAAYRCTETAPAQTPPYPSTAFVASTSYCAKLAWLDPQLFPSFGLPVPDGERSPAREERSPWIHALPLVQHTLLPARQEGSSTTMRNEYLDKVLAQLLEFWTRVHQQVVLPPALLPPSPPQRDQEALLTTHHPHHELLFLGTASAIPSKYRNVSAIALRIHHPDHRVHGFLLLDAGEGTWNQLLRIVVNRYETGQLRDHFPRDVSIGEVEAWLIHQIRVVWISHPHADHHLGLVTLLKKKARHRGANTPPMLIIAPPSVLQFLRQVQTLPHTKDIADVYIPVSNRQIDPTDPCDSPDTYWRNFLVGTDKDARFDSMYSYYTPQSVEEGRGGPIVRAPDRSMGFRTPEQEACYEELCRHAEAANQTLAALGIRSVVNVRVTHCIQSYGVSVELGGVGTEPLLPPMKIVYSGDTRPCDSLVAIGKDATILIHEATFEDAMEADAVAKCHSTISEAIEVGRRMDAFVTIATHFSQRYTTLPALPAEKQAGRLLMAFDFLCVRMSKVLETCARTAAFYAVLAVDAADGEGEEEGLLPTAHHDPRPCPGCMAGFTCSICIPVGNKRQKPNHTPS